jgi:hypothetical protein
VLRLTQALSASSTKMKIYKSVSFHSILLHSTGNEINIPDNIVEEIDAIFVLCFSIMYLSAVSIMLHRVYLFNIFKIFLNFQFLMNFYFLNKKCCISFGLFLSILLIF